MSPEDELVFNAIQDHVNRGHEADRQMLRNFRGRRLLACRAISTIEDVIANLGIQEGENADFDAEHNVRLPDDMPAAANHLPAISEQERLELKNLAAVLLRMVLIQNDAGVSRSEMRRF